MSKIRSQLGKVVDAGSEVRAKVQLVQRAAATEVNGWREIFIT